MAYLSELDADYVDCYLWRHKSSPLLTATCGGTCSKQVCFGSHDKTAENCRQCYDDCWKSKQDDRGKQPGTTVYAPIDLTGLDDSSTTFTIDSSDC